MSEKPSLLSSNIPDHWEPSATADLLTFEFVWFCTECPGSLGCVYPPAQAVLRPALHRPRHDAEAWRCTQEVPAASYHSSRSHAHLKKREGLKHFLYASLKRSGNTMPVAATISHGIGLITGHRSCRDSPGCSPPGTWVCWRQKEEFGQMENK